MKLIELITPSRRIRSADDFWKRHADSFDSDLDKDKLSKIVKNNYKEYTDYFNQKPNIARYGALALYTIGTITAGGAIITLAAGGPLTAIAGVSMGLKTIAYGSIAATVADIYDSYRAKKAGVKSSNLKQMGEGLLYRAAAYGGGGFVAPLFGPVGQIATFCTGFVDHYRGRKKFDDKVIRKINEESVQQYMTNNDTIK